jgi:hypothetical protein
MNDGIAFSAPTGFVLSGDPVVGLRHQPRSTTHAGASGDIAAGSTE